ALLFLLAFARLRVSPGEREPWLWAVVLLSVNPLAVLLHRNIWAQSLLPALVALTLPAWWRRGRPGGAFAWGFLRLLLGQIPLIASFLTAGFVAWALLFDRKGVAWGAWLLGAAAGALPMAPWLYYLVTEAEDPASGVRSWSHVLECSFWLYWVTNPLGLGLEG